MRTPFLTLLGFVLGLILPAVAFFLAGIGHGTYAPMFANISVLRFILVLGGLIALWRYSPLGLILLRNSCDSIAHLESSDIGVGLAGSTLRSFGSVRSSI